MFHLCDRLDGKNRSYRMIEELRIVSKCFIDGCFITYYGFHVSAENLYIERALIPAPKFKEYFYIKGE